MKDEFKPTSLQSLYWLVPFLTERDDLQLHKTSHQDNNEVLHATGPYHPGIVALNGGAAEFTSLPHAVVNVWNTQRGKNQWESLVGLQTC